MRTPEDQRIVWTLYSHPMKDARLRWKAHVAFEPGSTDESFAAVEVSDGEGSPVAAGVFEFAGCRIGLADGRGRMRCGDFAKGRHEPGIWLYRPGVQPVPGALTFE